jgi:hypothetical protein
MAANPIVTHNLTIPFTIDLRLVSLNVSSYFSGNTELLSRLLVS